MFVATAAVINLLQILVCRGDRRRHLAGRIEKIEYLSRYFGSSEMFWRVLGVFFTKGPQTKGRSEPARTGTPTRPNS